MAQRYSWMMVLLLLVACGGEGQLQISAAQIRAPAPGAEMAAGYLTIENQTRSDWTLESVAVDAYARVEMHETSYEGGMARMRQRDSVALPAGERVEFQPGGLHLMLMQPQRVIESGAILAGEVRLRNAQGEERSLPLQLTVSAAPGAVDTDTDDAHQHH